MKKKNINISLYILIPAIYTGISIITMIVAYQFLYYYELPKRLPTVQNFIYLVCLTGLIVYLISYIILRTIFKPLLQFLYKTKKMPIFLPGTTEKEETTDELTKITQVFKDVTNILSNIEAKELFPHIISSSALMRSIFMQITKVAPTESTVLITGESGTGKELIATSIHERSLRCEKPFIKINCVAIPEGLLESELFGHEKGSFTGAITQKKGKFEIADGGTVFLDEIGDMPLATQAKLLRVLQERQFERVGGTKTITIDVRFIAATNKDLPALIKEKLFREDLFFRLNVFSILLPSLRERQEDISILANHFLENSAKPAKLSTSALQTLIGYSWPGNIRELKNVLEQSSILSENGIIENYHLPDFLRNKSILLTGNVENNIPLDDRLAFLEKELIVSALRSSAGVQVKAANLLGINQRSLWHRIKKHAIDVKEVKMLQ
ncbi:MAG: sigma-54-dependent Fis family transcriptional regulator [Deltaproteobacteria bacterium HGW-Deltaproteobacteria-10]|nr:MAG: sigma-54-dependent Fis family transcriptional regulator [Deltaproteobacteria bacterium HGW-Deltaproteobacteria-10]